MSTLKTSVIVVMGSVLLALLMGCSRSSDQRVAEARADAVSATQDVKDAVGDVQTAAREDWLKFKVEAQARIAANEQDIAGYKARMATANAESRGQYDQKIDALAAKNKELKIRLDGYQESGKDGWEKFKSEFSHDLEGLGTAIKDFTVDRKH